MVDIAGLPASATLTPDEFVGAVQGDIARRQRHAAEAVIGDHGRTAVDADTGTEIFGRAHSYIWRSSSRHGWPETWMPGWSRSV